MDEIEPMIINSPEFENFKTWWEKPRAEHRKLMGDIFSSDEKSHWDEWKWWYIGGGGIILAVGIGLVVLFWDELTGSTEDGGKD
jgi:hypothetical protein